MISLDYKTLYGMLETIVVEKGEDYKYTTDPETVAMRADTGFLGCYYGNPNGGPGCIIGHVVSKLNPDVTLRALDGAGAVGALNEAGIPVEHGTAVAMLVRRVQSYQDNGYTWKRALDTAATDVMNTYGTQ